MRHSLWLRCQPKFVDPDTCKDLNQLWEALPEWIRLGEQVEAAGQPIPEFSKNLALEKLLPKELSDAIKERMDLTSYSARLVYVRQKMAYAKGQARAEVVKQAEKGKEKDRKDRDGDIEMGNMGKDGGGIDEKVDPKLLASLENFCGKLYASGDAEAAG